MENIEIKIRVKNPDRIKAALSHLKHQFVGCDHQVDTYFKTAEGRLKLRESSLSEPHLIIYLRKDTSGPRSSLYQKLAVEDASGVKSLLTQMLGVHTVVDKRRKIYLYENVRIHIDEVEQLGNFLEFEAVLGERFRDRAAEKEKIFMLMAKFGLKDEDVVSKSYENLMAEKAE
jgi:predicted adenylyl cyclase CyaB